MNFWPPKPGLTDMTSTRSILSSVWSSQDKRRRRIQHQAGLAPRFLDQADGPVHVFRSLRVEADDIGTGLGKIRNDAIDRFDHEVHVDHCPGERADRFADQRPDRQVGNVMIVHHVEVNDVGARGNHRLDFFAELGEIRGQDAGSNSIHANHCSKRLAPALPLISNTLMADQEEYGITVTVRTTYIPEQSDEAASRFVFAYSVSILNSGSVAAQLISRHWIITDGDSRVQEVRGLGVVGQQPRLQPGESYEYTSGTAIATPVGTMRGSYQMVAEDGVVFDAPIPEFTLSVPRVLH